MGLSSQQPVWEGCSHQLLTPGIHWTENVCVCVGGDLADGIFFEENSFPWHLNIRKAHHKIHMIVILSGLGSTYKSWLCDMHSENLIFPGGHSSMPKLECTWLPDQDKKVRNWLHILRQSYLMWFPGTCGRSIWMRNIWTKESWICITWYILIFLG